MSRGPHQTGGPFRHRCDCGEHAVKGIDGAQRHGVTDHQQVVGAIGKPSLSLSVSSAACWSVGAVFLASLLRTSAPSPLSADVSAQRSGRPVQRPTRQRRLRRQGRARAPVGGRGGAVAELGYGAPKAPFLNGVSIKRYEHSATATTTTPAKCTATTAYR